MVLTGCRAAFSILFSSGPGQTQNEGCLTLQDPQPNTADGERGLGSVQEVSVRWWDLAPFSLTGTHYHLSSTHHSQDDSIPPDRSHWNTQGHSGRQPTNNHSSSGPPFPSPTSVESGSWVGLAPTAPGASISPLSYVKGNRERDRERLRCGRDGSWGTRSFFTH